MDEQNVVMDDEQTTAMDDFYSDNEDASGSLVGKVMGAGLVVAGGAAAGFAFKNRDKIAGWFADRKEARRVKKVEKLMAKLNKLAPVENPTNEEPEAKEE